MTVVFWLWVECWEGDSSSGLSWCAGGGFGKEEMIMAVRV